MKINFIQQLFLAFIISSLSNTIVLAQDLPFNPKEVMPKIMELKRTNPDSALILINKYVRISRQEKWLLGEVNFNYHLAHVYTSLGRYNESIETCRKIIDLTDKRKSETTDKELPKLLMTYSHSFSLIGESFFKSGRYDSAVVYADKAYQAYEDIDAHKEKINTRNLLVAVYMQSSQLTKALVISKETIEELERLEFDSQLPSAYFNLGAILYQSGDIKKGLEYYLIALEKARDVEEPAQEAHILSSIGLLYERINEYKKGLSYHLQGIKTNEQTKNLRALAYGYRNTGGAYFELKQLDSARYFYNKSLEACLQMEDVRGISIMHERLSELALEENNPAEALSLSEKGLEIARPARLLEQITMLHVMKARSLLALNRGGDALADIKKIEEGIQKVEVLTQLKDAYWVLQEVYATNDQPKKAHEFLMKHTEVTDSLNNEEKSREIARVEFNYELEKETERLEAEKQSELEKQQWKLYSALGATLLILVIAIVVYRSYQIKKADNKQLSHQSEMLSMRNEELQVLREKEQEMIEKEREYMEESMSSKERQLATITMLSHEKNAILNQLQSQLSKIKETVSADGIAEIKEANKLIQNNLNMQNSWESFVYQFEHVHPNFFTNIKSQFPNLTQNELKIAAYIRIGFDNKEISQVAGMGYEAVRKGIYRLKKRLNLGADDNLRDFIGKI